MRKLLFVLLCGVPALVPAASYAGSLGIATALTPYQINGMVLTGANAVAEGAVVHTGTAPSQIELRNGTTLLLATRSEGTVYADHVQLQSGAVRATHFDLSPVTVRGLTVTPDSAASAAVVTVSGQTVEVASLGGGVLVSDRGAFLARVLPGKRMAFRAQDTSQTGASGNHGGLTDADRKALWWSIAAISGAAVVIGSIAAAEGKSPF